MRAKSRPVGDPSESNLASLIERTDLTGVRFLQISGKLEVEKPAAVDGVQLQVKPQIRFVPEGFECRFETRARLFDGNRGKLATIDVDIVASFTLPDQDENLAALEQFMQQVGYFVVYPYVRETMQSLATRLGLGAITLGLLQTGPEGPQSGSFSTGP